MSETQSGIRVVTLLGTPRPGSYTAKALRLVEDELQKREAAVQRFDPAAMNLTAPGAAPSEDAKRMQEAIQAASGVILSTPEYHGSFCSTLKLMIENLGFPSALGGKPVALLGVAAGRIGAIKSLEQLRGVCSHVGALVLPGPVSIAGVNRVFDEQGNCTDQAVEAQVRRVATNLLDYLHQHVCPLYALEAMVRK